ncbi:DUF1389 domain-containing protein [Chlamydia vaughanii]|uniref:DUF1389 domain-containing protein n=1 Tax=Chlamydia vaughanii TaxID=3112552 RepID=UPI0032B21EA0
MTAATPIPPRNDSTSAVSQQGSGNILSGTSQSRKALTIAGIFLAVLSLALGFTIACGVAHPAVIFGLVISVVLFAVVAAMAVVSYKKSVIAVPELTPLIPADVKTHMPRGFLNVIKDKYPKVIFDLCVSQNFTIQELRDLLQKMALKDLKSSIAYSKVQAFGLETFQDGCQRREIPSLDDVLLRHCPLYFLRRFIELGPKEIPQKENLSPEIYWTAHSGLGEQSRLILSDTAWLFSQVVTQEEYNQLCFRARQGSWDLCEDLIKTIEMRMKEKLPSVPDGVDKAGITLDIAIPATLLLLCKHGMGWEQLRLLRDYGNPVFLGFLANQEKQGRYDSKLAKLMDISYPYTNESVSGYSPYLALVTHEEFMKGIKQEAAELPTTAPIFYDAGVNFFNSLVQDSGLVLKARPLYGPGALILPTYETNTVSGERLRRLD